MNYAGRFNELSFLIPGNWYISASEDLQQQEIKEFLFVTIQPCINVIGKLNSSVFLKDTHLLNFDETNGNRFSDKKY